MFTAFADIALGGCAAAAVLPSVPAGFWLAYVVLALASGCLYLAGMVWNDVFDLAEDKKARAFRPLPSGRVGKGTAIALGALLFAAGLALAAAAGLPGQAEWNHEPLVFAFGIVAAVLIYDGGREADAGRTGRDGRVPVPQRAVRPRRSSPKPRSISSTGFTSPRSSGSTSSA